MDWKTIIEFVNILAWPVVVAVALLAFGKPLGVFLSTLSGRVTKLSAFDVSIELAAFPEPPTPWSNPKIHESSMLTAGEVSSTTLMTLFNLTTPQAPSNTFEKKDAWDYLVVDIKDGQFWLISRVFIFTVFLQAMRGVKCIVFVESKGEHRRRLIGLAPPDEVRAALVATNPWLEKALSNAMLEHKVCRLDRSLAAQTAGEIIRTFVEDPEMRMTTTPVSPDDWTQLGTQYIWEHTRWLTIDTVNAAFRKSFYEWDASHYKDLPGTSAEKRAKELLHCKAPFIALVNSKGEFQRLLDRQKLMAQVVETFIQ